MGTWSICTLYYATLDSITPSDLPGFLDAVVVQRAPPHCYQMELVLVPMPPLLNLSGEALFYPRPGWEFWLIVWKWSCYNEILDVLLVLLWYFPHGEQEGSLVTAAKGWNSKLPSGPHWHPGRTLLLASRDSSPSSPLAPSDSTLGRVLGHLSTAIWE